ncbi:MAP kinase phosphatase with leucine-rich repeats protein 1-like isoform X2 [Gordionus sp. m RMFG-2023]|uniref:MAP kinase phosphatase with leucine-rich repeats protein 1-like isoform X2 n=1 Tax=Gordionus sp. m RMFG-2023 TaxID=3053472 RepID=UPI0031FDB210
MASPFLKDIQAFSKKKLKKVQTKVITADGQRLVETRDAQGNIIVTAEDGTIIPSQAAPPDKISAPKPKVTDDKAVNGDAEAETEDINDNIKSGLDRSRLDRQASLDMIKSSTSLKNRMNAFGGGAPKSKDETNETPKKVPLPKSPNKIVLPPSVTTPPIAQTKSMPPPANKLAPKKLFKQDNIAEPKPTESVKKPFPSKMPSPIHEVSPPSRKQSEEIPQDAISKRMSGGKQCSEVLPGIVMGYRDLKERLPNLDMGITHVLNFLPRLTLDNSSQKDFIYKKVEIQDNPLTDIRQFFPECFEFIDKALAYKTESGQNGKVLLFCTENEYISSCIMIGYMIKFQGKKYKEAFDFLHEKRPNAKPGDNFLRRLKHFEKDLEEESMWDNLEGEDMDALAKALDSDLDNEIEEKKETNEDNKNGNKSIKPKDNKKPSSDLPHKTLPSSTQEKDVKSKIASPLSAKKEEVTKTAKLSQLGGYKPPWG